MTKAYFDVFIHRLWNKVYHRSITNNFPCKWHTSTTSGSKSSPRKIFHRNSSGARTLTSNLAWTTIACVASVFVWFRGKEIPRKGTFGFDRERNETRAKKWKRGGGGGEGRKSFSFLSSPPPPRSFTCATFLAVFDSRSSFFSPKPYRNACYAG